MSYRWTLLHYALFMMLLPLWYIAPPAFAAADNQQRQLSDYLFQEKASLSQAMGSAHAYAVPSSAKELKNNRQKVERLFTLNQVKINSLESFLAYQNRKLQQLNQRLKLLQQAVSTKGKGQETQKKIEAVIENQAIISDSIQLIKDNLKLAHAYQGVLNNVRGQLELRESRDSMENALERISLEERSVQRKLSQFYKTALKLQQTRNNETPQDSLNTSEQILMNTQEINLLQLALAELNLERKLLQAKYRWHDQRELKAIQKLDAVYQSAVVELESMEAQASRMIIVLSEEQQQSQQNNQKNNLKALLAHIETYKQKVHEKKEQLESELTDLKLEIKQRQSSRQTFSDYKAEGMMDIVRQVVNLPVRFYAYAKGLAYKVKDNYLWMDGGLRYLAWGVLLVLSVLAWWLYYFLSHYLAQKNRSRISGHLFDGFLSLLQRNIVFITLALFMGIFAAFTQIPLTNYKLLGTLVIVWLNFRVLIQIGRMVLMERLSDASGSDVRLYYRLRRLFLVGGWATAFMVVAHQLPASTIVQDIFNRIFMMFLMALALVGLRSREAIHHLLYPFMKTRKRYVRTAIFMLVILLPFGLAITSAVGLVGYFTIAWEMSNFLLQVVLVLSGYVFMRGMMFDGLELVSEWMIKVLKNGWLWIEVFLKPLDKIVRVLLLAAAFSIICLLIGRYVQVALLSKVIDSSDYMLVNLSGIHITIRSLIEFFILISVFMWASKWTREFGYRYLYRNARDAGIRNSFSVFTQYAVVLVGGLITLRVLGIDVSGMSVIVGGLAVGMGFGLRDFASNIVGGLMLLIERPVRQGDLITLGNYEGRVAHIGIRSMRVSSWDNMEVLIPNAETFNKPFTNWTHQDSIVRTVLPIKVSRGDDPTVVQGLILDVLAIIPEVLAEPPSQVYLKQIDDALIEFEVRYFINVEQHTRFEVRSKVLFAITAQFKAAGIKPPIPPLSVEIKNGEHYNAFVSTDCGTKK